jgi:hypothetical protein
MINLYPFLIGWMVVLVVWLVVYAWRRRLGLQEDESLHVLDSEIGQVAQQVEIGKRLDKLDHWVRILTTVLVVYSVLLAGLSVYAAWDASSRGVLR